MPAASVVARITTTKAAKIGGLRRIGSVRLTPPAAQCRDEHSSIPLPETSLPACHHQPRRVALPPILPQLPGCRGFARRTGNQSVVRNHSAVVREVRPRLRSAVEATSRSTLRTQPVERSIHLRLTLRELVCPSGETYEPAWESSRSVWVRCTPELHSCLRGLDGSRLTLPIQPRDPHLDRHVAIKLLLALAPDS